VWFTEAIIEHGYFSRDQVLRFFRHLRHLVASQDGKPSVRSVTLESGSLKRMEEKVYRALVFETFVTQEPIVHTSHSC
jgi:hypothetical protein